MELKWITELRTVNTFQLKSVIKKFQRVGGTDRKDRYAESAKRENVEQKNDHADIAYTSIGRVGKKAEVGENLHADNKVNSN